MDEVEKQKAIADLDNMFRDEEDGVYKSDDGTSPSSQLHHVSTNAANAGAAAADEDALLKHDISPTSCLGGDRVGLDDTSSHVGTVDDNANQDDLNNSITTQELRAAAKKEKRKRYGLYALIGVLGVIVVALAISLGVGAKKGEDYASQYSNAFNNAEDGNQGPPPGLVDESSYYGDGSPPPGVVVDSTSEGSIVENIPEEEPGSIVDIAAGNEDFSTLVAAVTAAGLLDALSGEGPITVFAPTNEAFAALPSGTVEALLLPENSNQLTDILKYHVVSADTPLTSSLLSLSNGNVETLNGDSVSVTVSSDDDGGIMVNDANVITPDIRASNGIIHVIDKVLVPPEEEEAVDTLVDWITDILGGEEASTPPDASSPISDPLDDGSDGTLMEVWSDTIEDGGCLSNLFCCLFFMCDDHKL